MAAAVAGTQLGNAHQPAGILLIHNAEQCARRRGEQGHLPERAHGRAQRTDDSIIAGDGAGQRGGIASVAFNELGAGKVNAFSPDRRQSVELGVKR
ncbi:hypothetical protein [Rhizobium leguminosarum]